MTAYSLKETFDSSNINEKLELEEGFLNEQVTSIIKQIIDKQLNKVAKQGQLQLSKTTIGLLKKLNKLGVRKLYGYDLTRAIPALERELAMDLEDDNNVATLLQKLLGPENQRNQRRQQRNPQRFPIRRDGRVIRWATQPRHESAENKYRLKEIFSEEQNAVQTEDASGYHTKNVKPDYKSGRDGKPRPQNKVPETPIKDQSDVSPPLSKEDVINAFAQDNAHYGEFDNALED